MKPLKERKTKNTRHYFGPRTWSSITAANVRVANGRPWNCSITSSFNFNLYFPSGSDNFHPYVYRRHMSSLDDGGCMWYKLWRPTIILALWGSRLVMMTCPSPSPGRDFNFSFNLKYQWMLMYQMPSNTIKYLLPFKAFPRFSNSSSTSTSRDAALHCFNMSFIIFLNLTFPLSFRNKHIQIL